MDLADLFVSDPPVRWFIAGVYAVDEETSTVTLTYKGGLVPSVGYCDHVTPVQGDVVHGLIWDTNGMLVIGTNTKSVVAHPSPPIQLAPIVIDAATWGTFNGTSWDPGFTQSPTEFACWFYLPTTLGETADLTPLLARRLSGFEVEVTRLSGGPPEFFAHQCNGLGDELRLVDRRSAINQTPIGVPTWVPLPVGWGEAMVEGNILGVGVGGGYYSGTYESASRLRFTPMA